MSNQKQKSTTSQEQCNAVPRRGYYMHGDRFKGDAAGEHRYYCSADDYFYPADHFEREEKEKPCGGQPTEWWIRRSMKSYKHHTKRGVPIYRPADTENPWKKVIDVKDVLLGPPRKRGRKPGTKY